MKSPKKPSALDRLVAPLADCLTPESARRIVALKPDPKVQKYVDDLASRHTEGRLTTEEQTEYGRYVSFASFIAILKSRARQILAKRESE